MYKIVIEEEAVAAEENVLKSILGLMHEFKWK
jgi:hypothetical protein